MALYFLWLILFSCVIKVFVQIELGRYSLFLGQADTYGPGRIARAALGDALAGVVVVRHAVDHRVPVGSNGRRRRAGDESGVSQGRQRLAAGLETRARHWLPSIRAKPEHPWAVADRHGRGALAPQRRLSAHRARDDRARRQRSR